MYALPELSKLKLDQFAHKFRGESIPLGTAFSYFCASMPLAEDDFKEYLEENLNGSAAPQSVQDIEAIMNKIIDARVEQKLAEQSTTSKRDVPDDKKGN